MKIIDGNIFRSSCQTIVNTVNCVGVMGAGLAFECRLRYPQMYQDYVQLCEQKRIGVGLLWLCRSTTPWILNFPTKNHWRLPSKPDYLHRGLRKFMDTYKNRGITSVAFPLLGAHNGGLDPDESLALMTSYLKQCSIPVEIYRYDATASDDLYDRFKALLLASSDDEVKARTGLRADAIRRLRTALDDERICQLSQLLGVPGIGEKTLEKCFLLVARQPSSAVQIPAAPTQVTLEF